ncbi:Conserved_hypothetical protein [Hexamita inflata]|uniref:Uncharacterized protein n=1 Tax=Hexamita inflata TaxID=28002 RepID=A0AA86Q4G5_9EUKA|nr:Conserved hypothetical protein [Hexamita inflata]
MFLTQKSSNIFIYTDSTQQSQLKIQVNDVNSFAVFGFNSNNQQLSNSLLNVTIQLQVITGALICIQCNVSVQNSTLIFIAQGIQISGIMIQSISRISLISTTLQQRFQSEQSSGIINLIKNSIEIFQISQCKIIGTNLIESNNNGYIASQIQILTQLQLDELLVCVNNTLNVGVNSISIVQNNLETKKCDVCSLGSVVYGLCLDTLLNGQVENQLLQCVYPFLFNESVCICADGYILNQSECVGIIQIISTLSNELQNMEFTNQNQLQVMQQTIVDTQNQQSILTQNISVLSYKMQTISQQLSQSLLDAQTELQLEIDQNYNTLDARIFQNVSMMKQALYNSAIYLEQAIIQNHSISEHNLQQNTSVLDQRIYNNISQLNAELKQQIKQLKEQLVSSQCTGQNNLVNVTNQSNLLQFMCSSIEYNFTTIDISTVTNPISAFNFSPGFVFFSQNTQNAFIDVQQISSVFTLFRYQYAFTNIKIQLRNLVFNNSGSLLAYNSAIIVNQMKILQKDGTSLSVNSPTSFSILQVSSTLTNITNLLINISFISSSSGSINLVSNLQGNMNICGYQIFGSYYSTNQISLGVIFANTSQIYINNTIFTLSVYSVGNQSSYLMCLINNSNIQITHILISLGVETNFNLFSSISSSSSNYILYGGLITNQKATITTIQDVSFNIFTKYQSQYVNMSGQLIGCAIGALNTINLDSICYYENIESLNSYISQFGMIGQIEGIIFVSNSSITFIIALNSSNVIAIGIIGYISNSQNSTLTNIQIQFNQSGNMFVVLNSAFIIGQQLSTNWTAQNIYINNSSLQANSYCGILTSSSYSNTTIIQITIFNVFLSAKGSGIAVGIVGTAYKQTYVKNTIVKVSKMLVESTSDSCIGTIMGSSTTTLITENTIISNISQLTVSGIDNCYAAGIIGDIYGLLQVSNAQVIYSNFTAQGSTGVYAGGILGGSINITIIQNTTVQFSIMTSSLNGSRSSFSGGFTGCSKVHTINGSKIEQCIVNTAATKSASGAYTGGFIGFASNTNNINCSSAIFTNISALGQQLNSYTAGFVACQQSSIIIQASIISNIRLQSNNIYNGIQLGYQSSGSFVTKDSLSEGINYINDIIIQNCGLFITNNQRGC